MLELSKKDQEIADEIVELMNNTGIVWNSFCLEDGRYKLRRRSSNFGNKTFYEASSLEELKKIVESSINNNTVAKDDIYERIQDLMNCSKKEGF